MWWKRVSQCADSSECSYALLHCLIISQQHSYSICPLSKKCLGSQTIAYCDCVFADQTRAAGNSGAGGGEHPGSAASFSPRSTPPAGKTRRPGPEPSRQLLSTDGSTAGGCVKEKEKREGDRLTHSCIGSSAFIWLCRSPLQPAGWSWSCFCVSYPC